MPTKLSSQQLRSIIKQEVKKNLSEGKKVALTEATNEELDGKLQDMLREIQEKFLEVSEFLDANVGLEQKYFALVGPAIRAVDDLIEEININNPHWFDLRTSAKNDIGVVT